LQRVREAATKQINALQPGDRVAIVTSSCSLMQEFTNDRAKLLDTRVALAILSPAAVPRFGRAGGATRSAEERGQGDGEPARPPADHPDIRRILDWAQPVG
jgi:hypothetical protein